MFLKKVNGGMAYKFFHFLGISCSNAYVAGNKLFEQCCYVSTYERVAIPVVRADCGAQRLRHCLHELGSFSQPFLLQAQIQP